MSDLLPILNLYKNKFNEKQHIIVESKTDLLMDCLGITPYQKLENKQYWGRELGMCWQRIIIQICKDHCIDFNKSIKIGNDEPCDLIIKNFAIDTKYRLGSGDSGTHKKFKKYAAILKDLGYEPVILILRDDNLKGALHSCKQGGWNILTGQNSLDFIKLQTGFDIEHYMKNISCR